MIQTSYESQIRFFTNEITSMRTTLFIIILLTFFKNVSCQDKIILANFDTLNASVIRVASSEVEIRYPGESFSSMLTLNYVNSIILSSGRKVIPDISDEFKMVPAIGRYKGKSLLTTDKNTFGMRKLGSAVYEAIAEGEVLREINTTARMLGAPLALYVMNTPKFSGQKTSGKAEFYTFINPTPAFVKASIVGKTFELLLLDNYGIGQSLLIEEFQVKTLNHKLTFSEDGKILENDIESGTYKITNNDIEIDYLYSNKKGKKRQWKGNFKIGSYDNELIQLYITENNFNYFKNIILKRI